MEPFSDPDTLRDRTGVPFHEETRTVAPEDYESVAAGLDSHAAVGIADDEGDVLLMNDGSHGWTLVAVPVALDEDWTAVARRRTEELLSTSVALERVELARRIDVRPEGDPGERTSMYNVIFRASVAGDPVMGETAEPTEDDPRLEWFETVPGEQEGAVADDIRLFLES